MIKLTFALSAVTLAIAVFFNTAIVAKANSKDDYLRQSWVLTSYYLGSWVAEEPLAGPFVNNTANKDDFFASGSGVTERHVRGAISDDPPWTDPFKPLSEAWDEHVVNYWVEVPPFSQLTVTLFYNHEIGHEQWTGTPLAESEPQFEYSPFSSTRTIEAPFYTRLRRWDTQAEILEVIEDL